MSVRELLNMLAKFPQDMPVTFSDYDKQNVDGEQEFTSPNGVELNKVDEGTEIVVIYSMNSF